MRPRPKYMIHPGYIISKADGDRHYIGVAQLVRLYELRPGEYVVYSSTWNEQYWSDYIHLFPDYDGNYGRPSA